MTEWEKMGLRLFFMVLLGALIPACPLWVAAPLALIMYLFGCATVACWIVRLFGG